MRLPIGTTLLDQLLDAMSFKKSCLGSDVTGSGQLVDSDVGCDVPLPWLDKWILASLVLPVGPHPSRSFCQACRRRGAIVERHDASRSQLQELLDQSPGSSQHREGKIVRHMHGQRCQQGLPRRCVGWWLTGEHQPVVHLAMAHPDVERDVVEEFVGDHHCASEIDRVVERGRSRDSVDAGERPSLGTRRRRQFEGTEQPARPGSEIDHWKVIGSTCFAPPRIDCSCKHRTKQRTDLRAGDEVAFATPSHASTGCVEASARLIKATIHVFDERFSVARRLDHGSKVAVPTPAGPFGPNPGPNSWTRQGQKVPAVLDQVETVRTKPRHRRRLLAAAVAVIVGLLAPTTSGAALAWQDDGFPSTTMYDDTVYNEPAYDDQGFPDDTVYDDAVYGDPCDPATYPDWANDPYCNPDLRDFQNTTTPPAENQTPNRFAIASSSSSSDGIPLIELDASEAPLVGAGRMLLAIDAIAELGGFERATTPGGAALLRDIRESIPAVGLDEEGYTIELEQFIDDFIPFLESLEMNGVRVSDDLWDAADALEAVVYDVVDPTVESEDLGLLEPRPWLRGIADLLVRGGEFPLVPTPERDEADVRELLAAFAELPVEATTSTTSSPETTPPSALALQDDPEPATSESSPIPMLLVAAGILVLLASAAAFFRSRRPKRRRVSGVSALHPERPTDPTPSGTQPDAVEADASKASVTELLDASRRMSASLDAATIASIALTEAKRIVGAEGGIVVRRTDNGLDPVGCEPPMLFNYERLAEGCLPRVIETGQSTAAIAHNEPLLVEVPMAMGAVPIVTDGVITGAILVVRISAKPFNRDELDALEMIAPLVGSAFAVADTHETATELVDVEPLTGLQNRRRLDLDLASISTDDDVAYVMVDIDHFKNFNDTNGHAAGDEAIRQVSALLQASVRPKDLVYRYGGEEFCVLLPGATAQDAAVVAERARAAVEAAVIPGMENQPAGVITISVGVSDSAFGTPDDLVERADAALYESKRNGRNRVTLSSAE